MNMMVALRDEETAELLPGTRLLNGQYEILEPLQKGGFAMTYVARDSLERYVVIKECFPAGLCGRSEGKVVALSDAAAAQFASLKQQFVREARQVAALKHAYVVSVHQVFEENNTAYMALDYVEGIDLISVLDEEAERLTPAFFEATLRETLNAVRHIHQNGILHRDIAPDNIRVDASYRITLIDFGAAGSRSAAAAPNASLPAVKDGYSPPEFYILGETQDASSDLYSVGATFYHLITGDVPPDGLARRNAVIAGQADPYVPLVSGDWACGHHVALTIDMALELDRARRPQTADLWLKALDETPKERPAPVAAAVFDPELEQKVSRLVRDVNREIEVHVPGKEPKVAAAPVAPKPKQWVDLFGNPIGDLARWLKEQEHVAPLAATATVAQTLVTDDFPDDIPQPPRPAPVKRSVILGLLSRCLSRTPATCAS